MYRKAIENLKEWKNSNNRKPLLMTGVRQCGKTYLAREFGRQEFEDTAYLNLDGDIRLQSVFDNDFNTERIIRELGSIYLGKKIVPGKTLLILDEIQDCPRAVHALKYFAENTPDLHIIAAGSLLGVALHKGISFPVGKVDRLELYPMSFEEFVIAEGGQNLTKAGGRLTELYTVPLEAHLKNYYIVGGMPEAVKAWVEKHDYSEVDRIQDTILKDYSSDFGKYASPETAARIKLVWDSIPLQTARENNKFIFSHVKEGARAKDLEDALSWLVNSGLAYKLCLVQNPQLPLSAMADGTYFKLYMSDVGLLRKKAGIAFRTILDEDTSYSRYKGAFTENFVMSQMKSLGIDCFFWRSKADAEVDFLTDCNGSVVPIEVKSSDNVKAKSLAYYCSKYKPEKAFRLSMRNAGVSAIGETRLISLPLYLIFQTRSFISSSTESL